MQIEFGWMDIFFRLSIFALLAYKLYDLLRTFAYPMFIQQIIRERNQRRELLEKENLLIATRHRFETQVYNQRKMFTLIERNVQNWHKFMQDEARIQEHQHKKIAQEIDEKRIVQQTNLSLQKDVEIVMPQAVEQAQQELVVRYGGKTGDELMRHTIDTLISYHKISTKNG